MIFGTPAWLWLCLAVLIPVLIHLWNRKSGTPQLLGTFRFLPEEPFAAAKRIELHEIPLMILRMLIVILIAFLLAGLFWNAEPETRNIITISEVSNDNTGTDEAENGEMEIRIPSEEIDRIGWWNIIEQVDHDFNPSQISVNGSFGTERFNHVRPLINATVNFHHNDSLQVSEKSLVSWKGKGGEVFSLVQRSSEAGITATIETGQDSEEQIKQLRMVVNEGNSEAINTGLEYVASLWSIEFEERAIPELAGIEEGAESTIGLMQKESQAGIVDVVSANAWSGIEFEVVNVDSALAAFDPIIRTQIEDIPFLYKNEEGNIILNGSPDEPIQDWVFVGLGSQLLLEALDIDNRLWPVLENSQREVRNNEAGGFQTAENKKPLQIWLLSLLLAAWLLERTLAPKRGM